MPRSDTFRKADRLYQLQKLFEEPQKRLRTRDLVEKLGVSPDTVLHYIGELESTGRLVLEKHGQYWMLAEDRPVEHLQVSLNLSEATALYVAARLLSQIHDERNLHVILALTKLVDAMPTQLRPHHYTLIAMAEQRQRNQRDLSAVFEALAQGWASRKKVRLLYAPPQKKRYECLFSPYLLEPSGIGHTLYAIGDSDPPGALRTYKLERIEYARLTEEPFTVPDTFNGPDLLTRAWGIMYGDEQLVQVHLRFSPHVTRRVKETLWHPSQALVDTPKGCEWTASIGDTLEIENWIRGWGSDCEVLAPAELRETIMDDVRRSARLYGIGAQQFGATDEPDADLFQNLLG